MQNLLQTPIICREARNRGYFFFPKKRFDFDSSFFTYNIYNLYNILFYNKLKGFLSETSDNIWQHGS